MKCKIDTNKCMVIFLLISSNSYTHLPQFDLSLVWGVPTLFTLHMLPQIPSPVVSNTVAVKTSIKMNINTMLSSVEWVTIW